VNSDTQIQTTLSPLIAVIAGIIAGTHLFGWDSSAWTAVIGGLVGLAAVVWGNIASSKANIISTAANQPEVQSIKLASSARALSSPRRLRTSRSKC
jgi:uncharacterized membrane protein YuzA (DUF378 family)